MARCASSAGVSKGVNLRGVVFGSMGCKESVMVNNIRFRNLVGEVSWSTSVHVSIGKQRLVVVNCSKPQADKQIGVAKTAVTKDLGTDSVVGQSGTFLDIGNESNTDVGGIGSDGDIFDGRGGNGKFSGGGGNEGSGDDGEGEDHEEKEFGPIMKYEEVIKETEARGVTLPSDMLEAAKTMGIRKLLLLRYLDLQGSGGLLGFAMKSCSMLRNRMLADPSFLFKVGTEIVIDTCCATFAEVQKRGKDFWAEFELFTADLLVGVVVNIGQPSISKGFFGRVQKYYGALPSSVFEAERPGCRFTIQQRIGTYFYKGVLYGSVGFACGIIGQGIANLIMTAKRSIRKSEHDIPVPPLVKTAALWGVFLGFSSNTRYQIINGLERLVEASPLAKQVPPVALAFTVGVRFANNVYGGMQFVDWARWSGVQ
ncbi:hypothetical protein K2173_008914 [Erythroxylum novogranatense]|uniref:Uncharacterized protein n=1 Tax=Erythroxylum novogranatense TaxID=1862640 RepID=A0AAV8S4S7_9ROSI|nr:hypothetical protein K2173_008914 [Erythroxylum novogranatense]